MAKKSIVVTGKKKSANARATVQKGSGNIKINSVPLDKWGSFFERNLLIEPTIIMGKALKNLDVDLNVMGGGSVSQAVASRVALARGVVKFTNDEGLKKDLLNYDGKILSGDSRQREPCKPNDSSARSRRQKSYR